MGSGGTEDPWANLTTTDEKLQYLYEAHLVAEADLDNFMFLVFGSSVYLMQWGFALLEAGSVRSKSTTNILLKNLLDAFVGAVCFYFVGYAFAFGEGNGFIGYTNFMILGDFQKYAYNFFQYSFLVTSVTIVSGSMAERTNLLAYCLFAALFTSFTYPVVAHWVWTPEGWLSAMGYHDLAGSSVVHCSGGVAGLVGTILLGKRETVDYGRMRGHSTVLLAIGFFLLSFGFIAFNAGSGLKASGGQSNFLGKIVINSVLSSSSAALNALFVKKLITKKLSVIATINGGLAGFVAICAGADDVEPYGALCIGFIAGLVFLGASHLLMRLDIDDPLDASPVHLGAGFWGVVSNGFFSTTSGIFYTGNFYRLGVNVMGGLVIIAWSCFWTFLLFFALKRFRMLRVSEKAELEGLDSYKHNENAYPEIVLLQNRMLELSEEIDHLTPRLKSV